METILENEGNAGARCRRNDAPVSSQSSDGSFLHAFTGFAGSLRLARAGE